MEHEFSFQEISLLLLALPVLALSVIAFLDIDAVNNAILKKRGTNAYDPWISNKEAWKAGLKAFYTLTSLSAISILSLYTYHSITDGQWFKNFLKWIFLIILATTWVSIAYRAIQHMASK